MKVIIVGGVAGGASCAARLGRLDEKAEITMLGRLLGAQVVGDDGVAKRIDAFAMAIQMRSTVYDLEEADLAYAPPCVGLAPEQTAIYVCSRDKALGLSNWLFGGMARMGKLRADMFTPEELAVLRQSTSLQIIDARVSDAGSHGHNYFPSNPAVSSDLILLMRYQRPPAPRTAARCNSIRAGSGSSMMVISRAANRMPGDTTD